MRQLTALASRKKPRRIAMLVFAMLFAVIGTFLYFQASAAPRVQPVTLFVSPASSKVTVGSEVAISVWVNASDQYVNAVQANLSYSADSFDLVKVDATHSPFTVEAQNMGGNGSIQIGRGSFSPLTGTQLVATIHLRAKSATRNSPINFVAESAVIHATTFENILAKTINGKYSIR